jgi:hypothetical protein
MSPPAEPDAYFRTVEEEFNRRRGAPRLLSPRDWSLLQEWHATGIPLPVVLQGIGNVFEAFERRGPTARRINSLSYCRQEILSLHEIYLGLRGAAAGRPGAGGGAPADPSRAVLRHLGRLTRRVKESMAACSQEHLDPLIGVLAGIAAELKMIRREVRRGGRGPPDPATGSAGCDRGGVRPGDAGTAGAHVGCGVRGDPPGLAGAPPATALPPAASDPLRRAPRIGGAALRTFRGRTSASRSCPPRRLTRPRDAD